MLTTGSSPAACESAYDSGPCGHADKYRFPVLFTTHAHFPPRSSLDESPPATCLGLLDRPSNRAFLVGTCCCDYRCVARDNRLHGAGDPFDGRGLLADRNHYRWWNGHPARERSTEFHR